MPRSILTAHSPLIFIAGLKSEILQVICRLFDKDCSITSLWHLFRLRKGIEDDYIVFINLNLLEAAQTFAALSS